MPGTKFLNKIDKKVKPKKELTNIQQPHSTDVSEYVNELLYTPQEVTDKDDLMIISLFNNDTSSNPPECTNKDADLFEHILPKLRSIDRTICRTNILYGFAGEVSIAKVRGETFDSFCRALYYLSQQSITNNPYTITCRHENIHKKSIFEFYVEHNNQNGFDDLNENFSFEYNELRNVFNTRSDLKDENTVDSDVTMIKILAILNHIHTYINPDLNNITDDNFMRIIKCLGLVASSKEVLDIGALYAILERTYNHNQKEYSTNDPIMPTTSSVKSRLTQLEADLLSNNNTFNPESIPSYYSTLKAEFPKNAVLETADGSAASIAGSQFTILTDTSKEIGRPTPFMNVNKIFRFIFVCFNEDKRNNIFKDIEKTLPVQKILKSIDILNILYLTNFLDPVYNKFIIDIFYFIINEINTDNTLKRHIFSKLNLNTNQYYDVKKNFVELFSIAHFIYISKDGLDRMKYNLMDCNFDSQCHDNKLCKHYRLICIYYYILFCTDPNESVKNLFATKQIDTLTTILKRENANNIYVLLHNEYPNISEYYFSLLLSNFTSEQQVLFYLLSKRGSPQIETYLSQKLVRHNDIILQNNDYRDMLFIISPIETISTTIEQPFELINKVPTEKQSIIGASLIPHYSNIAIDLGIHWTVSALKDVKQATYNTSELIFTPVSYSDAASNRMYNTPTQDKTPVRMPIMNYNYSNDLPPLQGGYTFIKSLKDNPNIINISETSIKVLTNNNFLNTLLDQITNLTFRTNEEVLEIAEIFVVAYNRFKPVKNVSNNKYLIQLSQEELERLPTYRNYIHTNDLQEEVNSIFLKMNELLKDYSSNKEGFSDTDSSSLNSFRDIFKDFFNTCNNFVNDRENGPKTKKPIIHFKFPEKIATMITSLVSFFGSRDQSNNLIVDTKNSNLNTIINYDLFNNYCEYLRFLLEPLVIQDRSLAKKFKEILDSSDRLVTPVIPVIPARTSKRAEEKSKNTRQKRDTQIDKIRFSRITGGTIDTKNNELFITDLVGPYGCYLSIGSNGQFIIEPINTKEKLQEINNMLHNLYSIFTTQTTTNYMAKGILPSISKSNEWWEQVEQKIKSNELYNALPESQKDEMYTKITSKIQENIKTMKDDVAIARAIYDTLKGLQLNVNISNKMTTGRTINDVPNMIKSTMNNGIAVGAGLTRRKLYKNKVTKRRKNNRVRKTKKNKKNKIKKYTRKYRH